MDPGDNKTQNAVNSSFISSFYQLANSHYYNNQLLQPEEPARWSDTSKSGAHWLIEKRKRLTKLVFMANS